MSMNEQYAPLLTSWKIGKCEIKNRFVMTSMGGTSIFGWMEPNHFDEEAAKFLLDRAKENVGLILPGIAPIRDILLGKWLYTGTKKFERLKEYMKEFHKTGCKLFVQLTAGFGRSLAINDIMVKALKNKALAVALKPVLDVSYLTASASATPNRWEETCISRPLTKEEIQEMIDAFAKISKLLKDADVDGVEIHAVHEGYLLDQFTMKYTNFRTDEYGGSFENRYRFPVEIVKAINDMLNCDNGTYDAWYWAHPPAYMPENCNLEEAKHIKKFVDIPVVCAGKMDTLTAAKAIARGEIDAMGAARPFLADPKWVTKTIEGNEDDIRPCIHCHNGCFNLAHYKGVANEQSLSDNAGMSRCAINPETMQSKKYKIIPAKKPKKVAIVGGGIGGMETARVLALRGHKPTIFEKSNSLGGVFVPAAAPSFKHADRALLKWYEKQMKDLKVDIRFNTEVKPSDALTGFDEVVVATGSTARRVPVKGANKCIEACDYLNGAAVGDKIVVIGGGLTGCEIALDAHLKGKTPVIVEMKNDLIAVKGVCLANSSYLREYFALHNVEVHLESTVTEVGDGYVLIKEKNGNEVKISADAVVTSVGYTPAPLELKGAKYVGDCKEVGNLRTVVWRAWDVAMKI